MKRFLIFLLLTGLVETAPADWLRFRGPNGSGIAKAKPPTKWSDEQNVRWAAELPGPGSSSPVVVGDRVFVTCWSGYGTDEARDAEMEALERHLVCLDRLSGRRLWIRSVKAKLPEERYSGMFTQHGYATHTPVSDGKRIFAYFGKSGVHAYDLDGKELWSADTGDRLERRGWGSASSPILCDGKLIVTASVEDEAMYAFDPKTGSQLWRTAAGGFSGTWGTPITVKSDDREDIVISVPYELWGLNPANGKLRWLAEAVRSDTAPGSPVAQGGLIYAMGERGGGGGRGGADYASPVAANGLMYQVLSSGTTLVVKLGEEFELVAQNKLTDGSRFSGTPAISDDSLFIRSDKKLYCIGE